MARLHPLVRQRRDRLSVPGLPAHKGILRDAAAAVANPPAQTKPPTDAAPVGAFFVSAFTTLRNSLPAYGARAGGGGSTARGNTGRSQ